MNEVRAYHSFADSQSHPPIFSFPTSGPLDLISSFLISNFEFLILLHAQPGRSQLPWPSARTRLHRFHRSLGTFLLLWNAGVACALHGQSAATSRAHRTHRRVRPISPPDRNLSRAALSPLASTIFGLYTGLVYLTPIAGGFIADRFLGRTRTITIGALLMSAGHFLMAFDATFLLALTCLLTGVGCFKGNLASQVGALYPTGDNRRADAFQIYYLFINGGVIAAPLIAGTLGEKVG